MGDLADVYEETRNSIRALIESRPPQDLDRQVPATPRWRVRDIVAHLIGDLESIRAGDFPEQFFQSFGDAAAIADLNAWTDGHVAKRAGKPADELFKEWDEATAELVPMMRGHEAWPERVPFFVDRVLITDLGVHQQDIYGAFDVKRDRESPPVKIGVAGYIAVIDMRLKADGGGSLAFEADKSWVAGENGGEPTATVRATRFELFRALSGRRSPDQIRSYDWKGDPEPFIGYFYPYGVRSDALVE
jgi:uncharacterized protein (TIGR03083 family)